MSLELLQSLMQRVLDGLTEVRREQAEVRHELAGMRHESGEMRHEHGGMRREQAEMRRQNGEMRSIALLLAEQGRRIERKVGEVRDEIKPMVKSELMGRMGHFETMIEARLDALAPHAS